MRRIIPTVTAIACMSAMTLSADRDAAQEGEPAGLVLSAAPQDAAVFAAWSPLAGSDFVVRWRRTADPYWNAVAAGSATALSIGGLANGVAYDVQVDARRNGAVVAASAVVTATPRPRTGCAALDYYPWLPPVSFFCTKTALDAYLAERAIDPRSLRCRQSPVTAWDANAPDCLYSTPSGDHLLLLRSADATFAGSNQFPRPADVRRIARSAIWGSDDPFTVGLAWTRTTLPQPLTGSVSQHARAESYRLDYPGGLSSRITWFVPRNPVVGRYSIYHEGHGGAAVEIGAETVDWLLQRGWQVIAVDMPLIGVNAADARPGLEAHGELDTLDDGRSSPLRVFLSPVQAVVDWIEEVEGGRDPDLLLIGRSGGGWTSYVYGAVDPRVDVTVSVAGGRPISERLDAPWGAAELGDYEQTAPHLYNAVGHEHLMLAAGARGAFYIYNQWDGCCFRLAPESSFVGYLRAGGAALGKSIDVFVDQENPNHSIGPQGYAALDGYVARAFRRSTVVPSAPTGMRVVR